MTCERLDCSNPRSTKAKYCGNACRKAAFRDEHKAKPKPAPKTKKSVGRDVDVPTKKAGCGHVVPGQRCLQKGCYGVVSKKESK